MKFRKEIQPTNDKGEPIGSPHVYEADTMEELLEKVAAGVANGTKKIHELSRQVKLGTPAKLETPEGLKDAVEYTPPVKRQLTADEQFELTQQLKDPTTVGKAIRKVLEAELGRTPEQLAQELEQARQDAQATREYYEAKSFLDAHPEYLPTTENGLVLRDWLVARKKAVTAQNLEIAFKACLDDGLLTVKPTEAPKTEPEPEPTRTEPEPEVRTRTANPPSALRRSDGTASTPIKSKKPSAAAIAMMTGDQIMAALQAGTLTEADLPR